MAQTDACSVSKGAGTVVPVEWTASKAGRDPRLASTSRSHKSPIHHLASVCRHCPIDPSVGCLVSQAEKVSLCHGLTACSRPCRESWDARRCFSKDALQAVPPLGADPALSRLKFRRESASVWRTREEDRACNKGAGIRPVRTIRSSRAGARDCSNRRPFRWRSGTARYSRSRGSSNRARGRKRRSGPKSRDEDSSNLDTKGCNTSQFSQLPLLPWLVKICEAEGYGGYFS